MNRSVYVSDTWINGKVYLLDDGRTTLGRVQWREEYGGVILYLGDKTALASDVQIEAPKKPKAADISCVHRGEPTRVLTGCGCGAAPGVYACAIAGECVPFLGTGKKEKAVRESGLAVCESCTFRTT